jgi:hypothetical protein
LKDFIEQNVIETLNSNRSTSKNRKKDVNIDLNNILTKNRLLRIDEGVTPTTAKSPLSPMGPGYLAT